MFSPFCVLYSRCARNSFATVITVFEKRVSFLFVQNQAHIPIIESENCSDSLSSISESGSVPSECPPWFAKDPTTGKCNRGPRLDGIIEQDMSLMQTQVMECYCMTENDGVLSVGFSLQMCLYLRKSYYTLPCDIHQLQNWYCPPQMNRRGYLCSQCKEGYGIPVYSYALECVKCKDYIQIQLDQVCGSCIWSTYTILHDCSFVLNQLCFSYILRSCHVLPNSWKSCCC